MRGWLLNLVYALAVVATCPIWLLRMIRHGKYRRDWAQRLGRSPRLYGLQPVIWIHGVSVGEINVARVLVGQLHEQLPDYRVVFSSTTDTGLNAAKKLFAPAHVVFRWPLDFTFSVRAALGRVHPSLVVLMEGDVWPNFVAECRRRGIPVAVVNGRVGPKKGYPRYRKIRPLAARLFNALSALGVQHEFYADLFTQLGVRPEKLVLTGMMKYDSADLSDSVAGQDQLAQVLGIADSDKLIVAGGTGQDEEEPVLAAFAQLRQRVHDPSLRLAIVPRKPERFDAAARLIEQKGFHCLRRSRAKDKSVLPGDSDTILLGDTMGELRKFYALAKIVFVGRSLTPEGGSDMIEAAAMARPVAFGPHTFNFPQAQSMADAGAAVRVQSAGELAEVWEGWLRQPEQAQELAAKGQQFVRANRGATRRNVEMLCGLLGRTPSPRPGGVATPKLGSPEGGVKAVH